MTLASPKGLPNMSAFPRSLSSMAVSVGGLTFFMIVASWFLLSHPIGYTVRSYIYDSDHSVKSDLLVVVHNQSTVELDQDTYHIVNSGSLPSPSTLQIPTVPRDPSVVPEIIKDIEKQEVVPATSYSLVPEKQTVAGPSNPNTTKVDEANMGLETNSDTGSYNTSISIGKTFPPSFLPGDATITDSPDSGCDLYHGHWFYDVAGPVYTNNTCPILTQMQNCQGNGRPDKDYENWRWKPSRCDLPRFDGKKFLELMRGKTLAFVGDSVARNQMESLLCLLWQVEAPKNRGNRRMQRWYFRSTSVMIVRIWSSWLVHKSNEPFDFAPGGVDKLHLDLPDETFMDHVPAFDVVVLSSGHWFAKRSVYIINNEIVGGQLWRPDKTWPMKINNVDAFGISVETSLTAMVTHPNYTGLTIVRSYSPDHYEGGAWNTGGSCTGKVRPATDAELAENGFTNVMHEKQVAGFDRAVKKQTNKSKLKLMDITKIFGYRHDGHPGPYRNPDPNKITKRGPDGKPPPQDCLHWCMPGPVDTWNELVLEVIRREFEFEGKPNLAS